MRVQRAETTLPRDVDACQALKADRRSSDCQGSPHGCVWGSAQDFAIASGSAAGRMDPGPVFSERLDYDQAPEALAEIPRKALFTR
jgi:hypothetical protein